MQNLIWPSLYGPFVVALVSAPVFFSVGALSAKSLAARRPRELERSAVSLAGVSGGVGLALIVFVEASPTFRSGSIRCPNLNGQDGTLLALGAAVLIVNAVACTVAGASLRTGRRDRACGIALAVLFATLIALAFGVRGIFCDGT